MVKGNLHDWHLTVGGKQ